MEALFFFLVTLALGTANPIGPTITEPSRDDLIKTAIDNNVQWLLRSIGNGRLVGPKLARAVVALFLAEPEFFSPGHEIGQELKNNITKIFRTPIFRHSEPYLIPSEELALYVQALMVSCVDPSNFFGFDLLSHLWQNVEREGRVFPSSVLLTLCDAGATSPRDFQSDEASYKINLSDEEVFTTMSIACLESQSPSEIDYLPIRRSGYRHYSSNMTVEKLQELMTPRDDPLRTPTPLSAIAAAMQTLMHIRRLRVSDLPSAVDFLLERQEADGSWGQSVLNSLFILPVLSNKSFLDISSDHCPAESGNEEELFLENEKKEESKDYRRLVIDIRNETYGLIYKSILHLTFGSVSTLYDKLTNNGDIYTKAIYHNGTDGKPYLTSLKDKENNLETGYFWFTYEQITYPKKVLTLLTQSHADIKLRRDRRYVLWYSQRSI